MKTRVVLFIMALCVAFTPAYSALRNHTWKANGTLSDSEKPQHPGRIASAIHYNVYDKYAVRQNRQKLSASADYIPMVAPGKVWRYNMKDYCYDPYDDRLCDILIGDSTTIIDGDEFYPLYICFDGERPNESTAPWGYARDNAAELRVEFRYNPTSENDETTRFLNLFLPKKYLYDFVNPDNEDAIFTALHPILEISDIGTGMTSEGKVYPGFVYDGDAYVQGLGYVQDVEYTGDDNFIRGRTLLGLQGVFSPLSGHNPILKIYEILDGDGKVLYKIPANRPSSGLVSAAGSTLQVRAEDCSVVVKAEAGMGVEVVTAQGIVAWHGTTDGSGRTRTDALVAGVYIVRCSGRTAKVVIK